MATYNPSTHQNAYMFPGKFNSTFTSNDIPLAPTYNAAPRPMSFGQIIKSNNNSISGSGVRKRKGGFLINSVGGLSRKGGSIGKKQAGGFFDDLGAMFGLGLNKKRKLKGGCGCDGGKKRRVIRGGGYDFSNQDKVGQKYVDGMFGKDARIFREGQPSIATMDHKPWRSNVKVGKDGLIQSIRGGGVRF
jgi:hypothetical protein